MSDTKTISGPLTILRRLGKLSLALALLAPVAACEADPYGPADDEFRVGEGPGGEETDGATEGEDLWQCDDGSYIESHLLCDAEPHCPDESDEALHHCT